MVEQNLAQNQQRSKPQLLHLLCRIVWGTKHLQSLNTIVQKSKRPFWEFKNLSWPNQQTKQSLKWYRKPIRLSPRAAGKTLISNQPPPRPSNKNKRQQELQTQPKFRLWSQLRLYLARPRRLQHLPVLIRQMHLIHSIRCPRVQNQRNNWGSHLWYCNLQERMMWARTE